MEIHLTPECEAQLADLARQQDKDPAAVAEELVTRGLDQHERIARKKREIGAMLEERWEAYESGRSVPIDGEQVRREMKAKTQALRDQRL